MNAVDGNYPIPELRWLDEIAKPSDRLGLLTLIMIDKVEIDAVCRSLGIIFARVPSSHGGHKFLVFRSHSNWCKRSPLILIERVFHMYFVVPHQLNSQYPPLTSQFSSSLVWHKVTENHLFTLETLNVRATNTKHTPKSFTRNRICEKKSKHRHLVSTLLGNWLFIWTTHAVIPSKDLKTANASGANDARNQSFFLRGIVTARCVCECYGSGRNLLSINFSFPSIAAATEALLALIVAPAYTDNRSSISVW